MQVRETCCWIHYYSPFFFFNKCMIINSTLKMINNPASTKRVRTHRLGPPGLSLLFRKALSALASRSIFWLSSGCCSGCSIFWSDLWLEVRPSNLFRTSKEIRRCKWKLERVAMVTQTLPEYTSVFTFIGDQFSHDGKAVKYPTTTAVEGSSNRYYVFAGSSYKKSISDGTTWRVL